MTTADSTPAPVPAVDDVDARALEPAELPLDRVAPGENGPGVGGDGVHGLPFGTQQLRPSWMAADRARPGSPSVMECTGIVVSGSRAATSSP